MAAERAVLPLSSLLALAHAASAGCYCPNPLPQKIFTALDARQGRIHWGCFIRDGGAKNIRRLTNDRLSPPKELLDNLAKDDILVIDTMGYRRSAAFGVFAGAARIVDAQELSLRRGLSCASVAFDSIVNRDNYDSEEFHWRPASQIVPYYLQASAAEEKRALCT
jgi:tRNA A37 threonylcarbamoyladenosine modification protein TsaB